MVKDIRRPLVAGNWKMHGSLAEAAQRAVLLRDAGIGSGSDVVVAPPFVHIPVVAGILGGSAIGVAGQDASEHGQGAFTGDVSASMLADAGCTHVIVGHSERRALRGETDAVVAAKCRAVLSAGLRPILCVGETLAEREDGRTDAVVVRQLEAVLASLAANELERLVLAYEPVWAIGTGRQALPEQVQAVHAVLRECLARSSRVAGETVRILYGGSVKAGNAAGLFAMPDVDGVLVGGASLDAAEFLEICAAAR